MRVSLGNLLAYRMNFFLQIIGPTLVFFFIKYSLWKNIFGQEAPQSPVTLQGYTFPQMMTYHFWVMMVSLVGQGHTSMNLSEDIRMGRISTYLIYPFNFWEFHTASFLSFLGLQLFMAGITLGGVLGLTSLPLISTLSSFLAGVFLTLLVSCLWFCIQYLLGLMSFWLEETWVLRVIFMIVAQFLSGAILPLEFFPSYLRKALIWTPFPYMTFGPVKFFMNQAPFSMLQSVLVLLLWTLLILALVRWVWQRGLSLYTAAGM